MERRDLLRILPIAALAPLTGESVKQGIIRHEVKEAKHYIFLVNAAAIYDEEWHTHPGILPEGSTGYVVYVHPTVPLDEALRIYEVQSKQP